VLCVVCEQPRRGNAIARVLDSDGGLGSSWFVMLAVVWTGFGIGQIYDLRRRRNEELR
jgi:hypothetical protein